MIATFYLLCGLPGSGKTTYARMLETKDHVVRYTLDEQLFQRFGRTFPKDKYQEYEAQTNQALLPLLKKNLSERTSVVLDYGFWKKEERDFYQEVAREKGAKALLIYFDIPIEILKRRLAQRNEQDIISNHHIPEGLLEKFMQEFELPAGEGEIKITTS